MTLYNKLLSYHKKIYPMHMPGHKGGRYKLIEDVYKIDVTEVEGTDHLYSAKGVLLESLNRLAEFYQTTKSIYLVNGSTVGILSSISGLTSKGDEILVARNCHQSVYHALSLNDIKPSYIYPLMTQWGLIGGIDIKVLKDKLSNNPKIVAFVLTSPTYDGFLLNIEEVVRICHKYNVYVIVDEAHGAHLPFSKQLPSSALDYGADVVIHSMHKTLPTITGCGLLHMNLPEDLTGKVLKMLQYYQTSSPSYIMMAQMDACVKELGNNEALWTTLLSNIESVKQKAMKLKKLYMIQSYSYNDEGIVAMDPLKNVVLTRGCNETGHDINQRLRHNHNIQVELSSSAHTLGIMTVADTRKALKNYGSALRQIDRKLKKANTKKEIITMQKSAVAVMSPYMAAQMTTEWVDLKEAVDRISGTMITPYPPGIPVVVVGEKMTLTLIEDIISWQNSGVSVLGIDNEKVLVLCYN